MKTTKTRIGFISTRLAGTDGVSLETAKWSKILTGLGYECFYFAGESDWPAERSYIVEEAHFEHPTIQQLNKDLFDDYIRSTDTSKTIHEIQRYLKRHLHKFVNQFKLKLLIVENALSIPMNIPLGMALTELIAETNLPMIGHHHDFFWERSRFAITAADDYLRAAFPPTLHRISHVVINSFARRQLALRTGASAAVIPNVMDFESPPPQPDDYARGLRAALNIEANEHILLQPTRIVPRKRIEYAIELAKRLQKDCALVISHASGDEGTTYQTYLQEYARMMGVKVVFAGDLIEYQRGQKANGQKTYSLADAYQEAELVTYPSTVEGFGNAFLETIYYRRPIVMSTYEIFKTDIHPKGFQVIGFEDFIKAETIHQAEAVFSDGQQVANMVEHNYELGRRHYSYQTLEKRLMAVISERLGDY